MIFNEFTGAKPLLFGINQFLSSTSLCIVGWTRQPLVLLYLLACCIEEHHSCRAEQRRLRSQALHTGKVGAPSKTLVSPQLYSPYQCVDFRSARELAANLLVIKLVIFLGLVLAVLPDPVNLDVLLIVG